MASGVVFSFDNEKGYGFIQTLEGEKIFVHHSSIEMEGFRTLIRGDTVTFDVLDGKRGREAVHVQKL